MYCPVQPLFSSKYILSVAVFIPQSTFASMCVSSGQFKMTFLSLLWSILSFISVICNLVSCIPVLATQGLSNSGEISTFPSNSCNFWFLRKKKCVLPSHFFIIQLFALVKMILLSFCCIHSVAVLKGFILSLSWNQWNSICKVDSVEPLYVFWVISFIYQLYWDIIDIAYCSCI